MRRTLALILGLTLGANSLWMLVAPEAWYHAVPNVASTGPMNLHFIRDIGCAYFVAALGLLWLARSPLRAWPAALAGGAFLALHAGVHVWDFAVGREHAHGFLTDLPAVFLPAILTLWLAWPPSRGPKME
jgi:uncharacterized protein YjeT (DUF2065 family)